MRNPARWFSSVAVAAAVLVACERQPADPLVQDSALQLQTTEEYPVFPSEKPFVELAQQVPGFGGLFFDEEGNLVAYLTDLGRADALRPLLQPMLQAGIANRAATAGARIVIRRGAYDFNQLRQWRDRLTDPVLSTPGVVFLDLDERQNRVVIGIHDPAARSSLERRSSP